MKFSKRTVQVAAVLLAVSLSAGACGIEVSKEKTPTTVETTEGS